LRPDERGKKKKERKKQRAVGQEPEFLAAEVLRG
jgi:hypothetical protein